MTESTSVAGAPPQGAAAVLVFLAFCAFAAMPGAASAERPRHSAAHASPGSPAHPPAKASGATASEPASAPMASVADQDDERAASSPSAAPRGAPSQPASAAASDGPASTAAQIAAANAAAGFPHSPSNRSWLGVLPALADRVGLGRLLGHAVPDGTGSSSFVALLLIAGGGFAIIGLAMRRFAFVPKRRRMASFAENPPDDLDGV